MKLKILTENMKTLLDLVLQNANTHNFLLIALLL